MIFSLRGIPVRVEPFFVVIDCAGVGYGAKIPGNVYQAIVSGGFDTARKEFTLTTRSVYSEDNAQLFGFLNEGEAALFDFIRSLHGFGPQAAMNIISTIGAADLVDALKKGDVKTLTSVPGVGKTKAEKLCFEAQSKKGKLDKLAAPADARGAAPTAESSHDLVVQALLSLGYALKEIESAGEKVRRSGAAPADVTRENLQDHIRLYLRNI
ncbi:Holliday junction branch migration protein RuvA [Turneriella parva]|uniref:Holliday junction branch migration complex subunit RuvA n=1 Tax=Turneriella parva (strain ATCC BAA-1111 / DSM 21527 / NCTC 11395 / H) TaxID=869212 RepID=I4B4I1_TURPD|nr:Holliday junction branch migration protein RuvA [Turneriella parva]AFM12188.1 Holliday junction DNA helicase subunit RuvA [Turneriella parva DSM 21527]